MAEPKPSLTTTYCWADGDLLGDEYGWMPDIEQYEESVEYGDEPRDVLIERWERVNYEVRTLCPPLYSCSADLDCDEDSVAWEKRGDGWVQVCTAHQTPSPAAGGDGS